MTLVLLNDDAAPRLVARIPQGDARREHVLRDLIFDNPAILPVGDLDPSYGRLFTVARELNIPGVGFVDVLLADARGRLVVVECKLWRNPQARREVVGQILDYARELGRYSYEDLQRQISIATRQSGNVLYAMARSAGTDLDEARFVDRVSRDLTAGRFLLLVVGDGITEGTRRLGEYLRDQPGLTFEFGLIEIAEYRYADEGGTERVIVQPRILAQTAVIERHVIRSEVPGITVDAAVGEGALSRTPSRTGTGTGTGTVSDTGLSWRSFVERFVAETVFDDPGQPVPRSGGNGWIRMPLPGGFHVNAYRTVSDSHIGVQLRFSGSEGLATYEQMLAERDLIDAEFAQQELPVPDWLEGEGPVVRLSISSPTPWDDMAEARQREWMGRVANQFVNSFRPRLQNILGRS